MLPIVLVVPVIPTPPVTTKAPVVLLVEAVELVMETIPDVVILLPLLIAPAMPIPPLTIRAPVEVDEEAVVLIIDMGSAAVVIPFPTCKVLSIVLNPNETPLMVTVGLSVFAGYTKPPLFGPK